MCNVMNTNVIPHLIWKISSRKEVVLYILDYLTLKYMRYAA